MSYFLLKARLAVRDIGQKPFLSSFSADGCRFRWTLNAFRQASRMRFAANTCSAVLHVKARVGPSPDLNLCAVGTVELILINLNAGVTFNDAPVSSLAETRRSCPMFELGHSRPGRTSGKNGDV